MFCARFSRAMTIQDELLYIPNDDKQNYSICRSKLLIDKFGHHWFTLTISGSIKVPKEPPSLCVKEGTYIKKDICNVCIEYCINPFRKK